MFYETAQTVGPGWSHKPSHFEDMTWSPPRHFRSPGASPEMYRRIIHPDDEFPDRPSEREDEFFAGRSSPTFPRRIFKESWHDPPSSSYRFGDRPRMFRRAFKPSRWDDEDDFERNIPNLRRVDRRHFDDSIPRKFDQDFDERFSGARELQKDIEEELEKGRVHHIPIMVERRLEEMKSKFRRNSPPEERNHAEGDSEEWVGPQVRNLRRNFEPDGFHGRRRRADVDAKLRAFDGPGPETWDPHVVHTLPTRKAHKNSKSFDDSKHPAPSVFRSYSETHEEVPKQQQHSAAYRSHSDGHCPKQTYVTKIEVNIPPKNEKPKPHVEEKEEEEVNVQRLPQEPIPLSHTPINKPEEPDTNKTCKPKNIKMDSPSLQQIAVVLQNVEDLVVRVDGYNGLGRDKQYRFLDEMLTRCMLRLDDVDTEGREDIRSARKAAVREVQSCIDKLEAKADESEKRLKNSKNTQVVVEEEKTNEADQTAQEEKEAPETNNHTEDAETEEKPSEGDEEQTKL